MIYSFRIKYLLTYDKIHDIICTTTSEVVYMVCRVCGRNMNLNSQGLCSTCYRKNLAERKQNGTYKDMRFRSGRNMGQSTLEIVKRLKAGEKQIDIAKKFGVTRQYISLCKKLYIDRL